MLLQACHLRRSRQVVWLDLPWGRILRYITEKFDYFALGQWPWHPYNLNATEPIIWVILLSVSMSMPPTVMESPKAEREPS